MVEQPSQDLTSEPTSPFDQSSEHHQSEHGEIITAYLPDKNVEVSQEKVITF